LRLFARIKRLYWQVTKSSYQLNKQQCDCALVDFQVINEK